MNTLLLLIRREFWEHRAFVFAPAIVAAIVLVIALMSGSDYVHIADELPEHMNTLQGRSAIVAWVLAGISFPFTSVMTIVVFFYLLDSLYADRKDRSVLFWKSLPLSDTVTVLAKLLTAAVVIPLLTLAVVFVTNLFAAFISSVRLSGVSHLDVWSTVWQPMVWLRVHAVLLYGLIASALWYLPLAAWLMLASAWARRAVILWAALPPLLAMFVEERLFDTNHLFDLLAHRLVGWLPIAFDRDEVIRHSVEIKGDHMPWPERVADMIDPVGFVSSVGLWGGLLVAGLLIWATIVIRRRRSDV